MNGADSPNWIAAEEATHFTLEQFTDDYLSFAFLHANGELMVFPSFDAAVGMAEALVEDAPTKNHLPLIGILAWKGDPEDREIDDPESWSAGWVEYSHGIRSVHEGDYENDPEIWLVRNAVARGKKEILEDVRSGRVPAHVESFGDLHDFVDANEYGGLCEDHFFQQDKPDLKNSAEVQEQLHQWIKSGDMANEAVQPCEHCKTPVFWDESALDYRHVNPTEGCPMALEPKPDESKRTILIHLNVEASGSDERSGDEIIDSVLAKVEVGLGGAPGSLATGSELEYNDYTSYSPLVICLALAEEV